MSQQVIDVFLLFENNKMWFSDCQRENDRISDRSECGLGFKSTGNKQTFVIYNTLSPNAVR